MEAGSYYETQSIFKISILLLNIPNYNDIPYISFYMEITADSLFPIHQTNIRETPLTILL